MKFDIGFDLDGVVFNCIDELILTYKGLNLIPQDFKKSDLTYSRMYRQFGLDREVEETEILCAEFFSKLMIYPDIVYDIKRWMLMGVNVCFVTARRTNCVDITKERLNEFGLLNDNIFFSRTSLKHNVIYELGLKGFVDDDPVVITNLNGNIPFVGCIPYSYNSECGLLDGVTREYWPEMANKIDTLIGEFNE
jgi:hypothetical protein